MHNIIIIHIFVDELEKLVEDILRLDFKQIFHDNREVIAP